MKQMLWILVILLTAAACSKEECRECDPSEGFVPQPGGKSCCDESPE